MRVVIFCSTDISKGTGSAIRARLIIEGLRYHGANLCIVSGSINEDLDKSIIQYNFELKKSWYEILDSAVKSFSPDILFGITEAGTDIVYKIAKKNKIPFVFDLHGIGIIEIIELGGGYGSRIQRSINSLKWLSIVPKADAITVANPTLFPVFSKLNKNTIPIIGMTNVSQFCLKGPKQKIGDNVSNLQILYAGNFLKWQGIDLLFKSISKIITKDDSVEFTLIGSIETNRELIEYWGKRLPKEKVHIIDRIHFNEISNFYRGADVLIIPRRFMISTYFAFPQKIVDYMASERTIIATNLAPHRWALESPQAGILCKPNSNSINSAIISTYDLELRKKVSLNARKIAEKKFCHIKQCERIFCLFEKILSG